MTRIHEQLQKRGQNIYLLRSEFIFQLKDAMVAETPQLGHAPYVFRRPTDVAEFVHKYTIASRDRHSGEVLQPGGAARIGEACHAWQQPRNLA